jgi:hypothetical protein
MLVQRTNTLFESISRSTYVFSTSYDAFLVQAEFKARIDLLKSSEPKSHKRPIFTLIESTASSQTNRIESDDPRPSTRKRGGAKEKLGTLLQKVMQEMKTVDFSVRNAYSSRTS